jgi:type VI secretion system secreted protein VgrG
MLNPVEFHLETRRWGQPAGCTVVRVELREGLSTVGGATLTLLGEAGTEPFADPVELLGEPATLAFHASGGRAFHGIVTAARLELRESIPAWVLELAPRLWRASRSRRSRVYLDVTTHDLARRVLQENGFLDEDWEWRCATPTARRAYVAQYEETDLDFLHRALEREGIAYFIAHEDGRDRMVFADHNGAFEELDEVDGAIAYAPQGGGDDGAVGARDWVRAARLQPRSVAVRDYQPGATKVVMNPRLAPVMDDRWTVAESGLQSFYGDNVTGEADATRMARLRAEALRCAIDTYEATTQVTAVRAGGVFTLRNHPTTSYEQPYVVVHATHHYAVERGLGAAATAAPRYHNELVVIPRVVPFRPARVTPRPVMPPWIPGVIDAPTGSGRAAAGAADTTSPLDEAGCYRVLLPFDTTAVDGQVASCPIALAQSFGGQGFGQHHPLHRGTHVLIGHVHGDPDRPVIVAALMPSAVRLPTSRGQSLTRGGVLVEYDDHAPPWRASHQMAPPEGGHDPGKAL